MAKQYFTKKPTADEIVMLAEQMRRHQKAFFAQRDAMEFRKSKELEEMLDQAIELYHGKQDTQKANQLNIFQS